MRFFTRIPWLLLLLLLIAVAWSIRPVSDPDILWHLRTGQWMLARGDVIRHDVFSATRLGCEWVSVPWLYEVMLAQVQACFGWGGITLWQVGMLLAITLQTSLLVWLLRRSNSSGAAPDRWNWKWPYLSVPTALAVLLTLRLLQLRINCRPEWFSYLFIGSFLIVLTITPRLSDFRLQGSRHACHHPPNTCNLSLLLWLLPLLQVLWTNTHGAFILGPLLVWGYAVAAWVCWLFSCGDRAVAPARPGPRADHYPRIASALGSGASPRYGLPAPIRLTVAAILTTLACFATPYGLAGTFYPFHLFHVLTDPLYKNSIVEAQPIDFTMVLESGSLGYVLLACWVFAGLGLLGRLLECMRGRNCKQLAVSADQSSVIHEYADSSKQGGENGLLPTAHSLLVTMRRILNLVAIHTPGLGYIFACAAMAYLSLSAIRNVPLLPLVVAPLVASGIEYAADGLAAVVARLWCCSRARWAQRAFLGRAEPTDPPPQQDKGRPLAFGGSGGPALPADRGVAMLHSRAAHLLGHALLALALLGLYRSIVSERFYTAPEWRVRFAVGFSDHEHPLAACDFVARHRAEIACRTLYGDTRSADLYLARFGPQWPVYFDGRHAEIYDPPIFHTAARTRCDPALFDREAVRYGIGLACFSLVELKEERSPLAVALGQTNTWRLVYLDDCAALFAADAGTNAAFVARYGLPCAPTNAALQRQVFADWLQRQGRADLAALHDPANRALEEGGLTGEIVNLLQLHGLWAPLRHLEPLRFCRLASFLDHLGWTVVADDLYQQALRWPENLSVTLPRAIRHAQSVRKAVSDPVLNNEMRERIRSGARALQSLEPQNPVVAAALDAAK